MKTALVLFAAGSEELETVSIVNLMRRAGIPVTLAGLTSVLQLIKQMASQDKFVAAICAAPMVLAAAGLLDGKRATCYPTCLNDYPNVLVQASAIVEDGKLITSRGPGTAMDFALLLVERLAGKLKRDEVEAGLVR